MKQKALAIAGCIAVGLPSVSTADLLPENLLGLNLGEISSSSFINQPFKGVIPLLSNNTNAKNISVQLAPKSVFDKIGAEKHPILNDLNFQVTNQENRAVILISSNRPINLPFLNFVLEIKESGSVVYQDYTVLLDPVTESNQAIAPSKYISTNRSQPSVLSELRLSEISLKDVDLDKEKINISEDSLRKNGKLLLAALSKQTPILKSKKLEYKTRSGDSLSKIVQEQNSNKASLKKISQLIFEKNPKAFIRGDINRLRRGVTLNLPDESEINDLKMIQKKIVESKKMKVSKVKIVSDTKIKLAQQKIQNINAATGNLYTVLQGDNLSTISKKHTTKDTSFTKTMNFIFNNNPEAFVENNKNSLKVGVDLIVPNVKKASQIAIAAREASPVEKLVSKVKEENTSSKPVKYQTISKAAPINVKTKVSEVRQLIRTSKSDDKIIAKTKVQLKKNQYSVESGDTLSEITKLKGHKEVPFAKMLKLIYRNNPTAFVNGRISRLAVGAIITIPPLSEIEFASNKAKLLSKTTEPEVLIEAIKALEKPNSQTNNYADLMAQNNARADTSDLIKRIRELRKELQQTKQSLTNLKGTLSNKETLLEQKNIQLESLNTLLSKADPSIFAGTALRTSLQQTTAKEKIITSRPKSKAEMAKLKRELFNKRANTRKQLIKIKELKNKIAQPIELSLEAKNDGQFKEYSVSSLLNLNNSNYAYLSIALILCLLLLRYRRELYSLTYSKINMNKREVYYPVPEHDKYDLSEKNINYAESVLDDFAKNYKPPVDQIETKEEPQEIIIDPILIEKKEEVFKENTKEEQIKHCEHLVTELFDDLDEGENTSGSKEWERIEKVCDSFIEKITISEANTKINKTCALPSEVTDFNDMMSDLLESLDKVDKSVKQNNLQDEDFPEIVGNPLYKPHKNRTYKNYKSFASDSQSNA